MLLNWSYLRSSLSIGMGSRHRTQGGAAWSWRTTASTSFLLILSHVKRGTCTQHTFAVAAYGPGDEPNYERMSSGEVASLPNTRIGLAVACLMVIRPAKHPQSTLTFVLIRLN